MNTDGEVPPGPHFTRCLGPRSAFYQPVLVGVALRLIDTKFGTGNTGVSKFIILSQSEIIAINPSVTNSIKQKKGTMSFYIILFF